MKPARWITKALLLTAAAALLTACEKPDDTFRVLWKSGRLPGTLLKQFGERPDIKLAVETYTSDGDLLEKLSAKDAAYDLIEADDRMVRELAEGGRLRPLDRAKIPNLANIDPAFSRLTFDPGGKYSAPYMAAIAGIVYNAEAVALPVVGFADVFHPEYTGRIAAGGDPLEIAVAALLTSGLPVSKMSADDISQISPLLADWLAKTGDAPFADPAAALLKGEADIGIVRSDDAARLFAANPGFQWVLPAEGFRLIVNALVIPKTARHTDTAEALINFLLAPENGRAISEEFPGYNPNAAARELLSEAQRDNPASYPTGLDVTRAAMLPALGGDAQKIRERITSLKAP